MLRSIKAPFVLCALLALGSGTAAGQAPVHAWPVAAATPATAYGNVPVTARAMEQAGGARIVVQAPADTPGIEIGPGGRGADGAPALTALNDDDFLVVAARWRNGRARLWAQVGGTAGWDRSRRLRGGARSSHHPAAAGSGDSAWITWVNTDAHERSWLVAARWLGDGTTTPEPIPAAPGAPGRPAIGVDARGIPVVVWAASDGEDTETWWSRRATGGWTEPRRLTNNDVPDEHPAIAAGRQGEMVVAWTSFTPTGYQPWAATVSDRGAVRSQRLDTTAAGPPVVVGGPDRVVAWSSIHAAHYELRTTAAAGAGWQRARRAGTLPSPRLALAERQGRVVAATSDRAASRWTGALRRGARSGEISLGLPDAPRPAPRVEFPELPGSYRAFGDSITEGVVRFDGVISFTPGYPFVLQDLIAQYLGRKQLEVHNAGFSGELTAEGVGRLAALNNADPRDFTFIMEGANDASTLVATETVVANLRAMIIHTSFGGGIPVLSPVTPRVEGNFQGGLNPRILRYNDAILPMARAEGALVVDQWEAFYRRAYLYSDTLHPNEQGYAHMAVTWFQGLQPLFTAMLANGDVSSDALRDEARALARAQRERADGPQ